MANINTSFYSIFDTQNICPNHNFSCILQIQLDCNEINIHSSVPVINDGLLRRKEKNAIATLLKKIQINMQALNLFLIVAFELSKRQKLNP